MNTIYNQQEIIQAVISLSLQINDYYKKSTKPLLLIGLLNGSYMFMADLSKYIRLPCEVEFVKIHSYDNNIRSDNIEISYSNLSSYNLNDYNILVIEDIVDTGYTIQSFLNYIKNTFSIDNVKVCSLIYKKCNNLTGYEPDWYGLLLNENKFLVGYGMDNDNKERNLPYIYSLN